MKSVAVPPARGVEGEKVSTEKRKASLKGEAVLCPSIWVVTITHTASGSRAGGIGRTKKENNTECAINHLNPDQFFRKCVLRHK